MKVDPLSQASPKGPGSAGAPPASARTHSDEDAALVKMVLEQHPRAAAMLWDRFSPQVRRIIRRALGAASPEIEDLVQEVFLRVFHNLGRMRQHEALHNFILMVTSSVLASEFRKRKVRRFLGLTSSGVLPDVASDARDDDAREVLRKITAVLDRSSPMERMAFVLRTVEGVPLPAVAIALETSEATVKRRLARLQDRLQRAVARDPGMAAYLKAYPGFQGQSGGES